MKRFKNILFFCDGSDELSPALRRATHLAESNHARLTLVDVIEPVETPAEVKSRFNVELVDLIRQHRNQALQSLAQSVNNDENIIYTKVLSGLHFVEVIKYVQAGGFDLLIKQAHPPAGFSGKLFGSIDLHLLRKCPCPVLIDRPGTDAGYQRILAAVDNDSVSSKGCDKQIMQLATSLSVLENARLDVVHVWSLQGESAFKVGRFQIPAAELEAMLNSEKDKRKQRMDLLLQPFGMDSESDNVHLVKGQAAELINQVATENAVDIIVMGSVGRIGIPGLFIGNTAEEVFQTTQCSVMAIKPIGFETPVR